MRLRPHRSACLPSSRWPCHSPALCSRLAGRWEPDSWCLKLSSTPAWTECCDSHKIRKHNKKGSELFTWDTISEAWPRAWAFLAHSTFKLDAKATIQTFASAAPHPITDLCVDGGTWGGHRCRYRGTSSMLITNFDFFYPRTHAPIRGPYRKFPPLHWQLHHFLVVATLESVRWLWKQRYNRRNVRHF